MNENFFSHHDSLSLPIDLRVVAFCLISLPSSFHLGVSCQRVVLVIKSYWLCYISFLKLVVWSTFVYNFGTMFYFTLNVSSCLQVSFFNQMDDNLLNALCERLKPAYYTKGMYITSYGAPMYEMLFITNGELENVITSRGHTIFPNIGILGPGDFYGEELLTWALDPMLRNNLPTSTHTIRTLKEVDAFALSAEDLKFVVGQFQHLHDNQFQYISRFVLLILLLVIFC